MNFIEAWKNKRIKIGEFTIIPLSKTKLVDVFWGFGWENWARFSKAPSGTFIPTEKNKTIPNGVAKVLFEIGEKTK